MRIIHCFRAPVGGLFRHVLDLASAQAALGHEVGLVVDSLAHDPLTDQRLAAVSPKLKLGITRVAMPRAPSPADLRAASQIAAHATRVKPDVIHGHGAKGGAFARLAGLLLKLRGQGTKVYYTPHGGTLNYAPGSLEGKVFVALERVFDAMSDGIIFESAFAARTYAERICAKGAPKRVIVNGLAPSDFVAHEPHHGAADFVFVGELRQLKGVDVLIKALSDLPPDANGRRPSAVIVGSGPDQTALRILVAERGLHDRVSFPGAMPAAKAFALGRALVVPSRKESFPYVVLEAAAAGIPLIATDVGGIPEIVAGTDTALVPSDNVSALAAAMAEVSADPESAKGRAQRLKARVAQRFTVEGMTHAILEFYADGRSARAVACQPMSQAQW